MRANKVKRALKQGETVFGTMVQEVRTPGIAQVLAVAGFDFFFIDMEHGPFSIETAADIILAARLAGIAPFVRVPDLEYSFLARPLDAGAQGLMVPQVDTPEQVRKLVSFMKYPPVGERGCAVLRAHSDYRGEPVREFIEHANAETMVIVQVESSQAVEHIEEMVSVPGVDAALVGPNDLSISMGIPGQTDHPKEIEAIESVIAACEKHGVAAGIHLPDAERLKEWMARGMRLITWSSDLGLLLGARRTLESLRAAVKP